MIPIFSLLSLPASRSSCFYIGFSIIYQENLYTVDESNKVSAFNTLDGKELILHELGNVEFQSKLHFSYHKVFHLTMLLWAYHITCIHLHASMSVNISIFLPLLSSISSPTFLLHFLFIKDKVMIISATLF